MYKMFFWNCLFFKIQQIKKKLNLNNSKVMIIINIIIVKYYQIKKIILN